MKMLSDKEWRDLMASFGWQPIIDLTGTETGFHNTRTNKTLLWTDKIKKNSRVSELRLYRMAGATPPPF